MIHVLTKCPVCTHQLKAVKLHCQSCGTQIENTFDFPKIMHLTKEQLEFVEVFIKSRGNIKDVEKELGLSYPTIRTKLDQVIEALGESRSGVEPEGLRADAISKKKKSDTSLKKQQILDQLESGELSAEEALALLQD